MKTIRLIMALGLLWVTNACAAGQDFSRYDLSTDDGVNAARAAIRGKEVDRESKGCLRRNEGLPGIVVVGGFAYDRGCDVEGVFVGKKYYAAETEFSQQALAHLGWARADARRREELALKWVRFGLLAFEYPLESATKDFKTQKFEAPRAVTDAQGEVSVSLWNQEPSGMVCETAYQRLGFTFDRDGGLKERKILQGLRIPCKGSATPGRPN